MTHIEDWPSPSDFREEMIEKEYQDWCRVVEMDPDEQETARTYEDWFAEHQDPDR